jgi:hypothetical protein
MTKSKTFGAKTYVDVDVLPYVPVPGSYRVPNHIRPVRLLNRNGFRVRLMTKSDRFRWLRTGSPSAQILIAA